MDRLQGTALRTLHRWAHEWRLAGLLVTIHHEENEGVVVTKGPRYGRLWVQVWWSGKGWRMWHSGRDSVEASLGLHKILDIASEFLREGEP